MERALEDDESLIRHSAIRMLNRFQLTEDQRLRFAIPLLYDTVRALRMEASMCLSPVPEEKMKDNEPKLFDVALAEYKKKRIKNTSQ